MKKACLVILFIAGCSSLNAQFLLLEKTTTVLPKTELKIERGGFLVYWKPLYCDFPGNGYRLEVLNGTKRGGKVRSFSVNLYGQDILGRPEKSDHGANWEGGIHLEGRSILRVKLYGQPGEGITLRIWGEAGKVYSSRITGIAQGVDMSAKIISVHPVSGSMHGQNVSSQQAPKFKTPEHQQPLVSLQANKDSVKIGQVVRLTWDAQNATSVQFTSGDLGRVDKSGSAWIFPEKDTAYQIKAQNWNDIATAEFKVRVEVPAPRLKLKIKPKTITAGQEVTMTWKTKNAKMVRYGDKLDSFLPISGKKTYKPAKSFSTIVQAENGDKTVQKTISVTVNRKAEQQQSERDKASRTIPKDIDKKLHGIWDELKAALLVGDPEKAANMFCLEEREKYLEIYKSVKDKLPQIGAEMRKIEFLEFQDNGAKYRTKRKEVLKGKKYDISYYVYFAIDLDGQWRIYNF